MAINEVGRDRINRFKTQFREDPNVLLNAVPVDSISAWGPKHIESIKLRRTHQLPSQAVSDVDFLVNLHSTLVAWRIARAGLVSVKEFATHVTRIGNALDPLSEYRIEEIHDDSINDMTKVIWAAISNLPITDKHARMVYGSKAIHHLLPDLVPPMDRKYTGYIFGKNNCNGNNHYHFHSSREAQTFSDIFPEFIRIAKYFASELVELEYQFKNDADNFNTSIPKILDNAIVGFLELDCKR